MMTLTFDNRAPDPLENPKYYSLAWNTFLKRLRRKYPTIRFARVVELTRSGRPHFHVLLDRYVPQRYVSWAFASCGGGKVADCRYIDPGRAGHYITKYVTKSYDPTSPSCLFFFSSRMRTISTSRNLYYKVPQIASSSCRLRSSTEFCLTFLQSLKNHHLDNHPYFYDSGDRGPPILIYPTVSALSLDARPFISPIDSLRSLQLFSLDLSHLPSSNLTYVHFPPFIDSATATYLLQNAS